MTTIRFALLFATILISPVRGYITHRNKRFGSMTWQLGDGGVVENFVTMKTKSGKSTDLGSQIVPFPYPIRIDVMGGGNFGLALAGIVTRSGTRFGILARSQKVSDTIDNENHHPTHMTDYLLRAIVSPNQRSTSSKNLGKERDIVKSFNGRVESMNRCVELEFATSTTRLEHCLVGVSGGCDCHSIKNNEIFAPPNVLLSAIAGFLELCAPYITLQNDFRKHETRQFPFNNEQKDLTSESGTDLNDPISEPGADKDGDGNEVASTTMIAAIGFYKQFISPLLPPACRFLPTCSQYGVQAIQKFGADKGAILIAWRLLRCSPIGGKGYDPPCWPPVPFTYSSY